MIAYGLVAVAPWYYYALLLPLIISFVYVPSGIGAICCLFIIHKLPNLRRVLVVVGLIAVVGFVAPLIWRTVSSPQSKLFESEWFNATWNTPTRTTTATASRIQRDRDDERLNAHRPDRGGA